MTQVLNNSVSLNNLDISPRNFNSSSTNNTMSKEFCTPIKSASESTVMQSLNNKINHSKTSTPTGVEIIIENSKPDPVWRKKNVFYVVLLIVIVYVKVAIDEMEKKKERILLLSLQRRQQQEELKNKKDIEAQKKKDKEKEKLEMKQRKKLEEKERRASILEQYRIKKAIDEAEREVLILKKK